MKQTARQIATPAERLSALFSGALIELEGGCPPDPRRQLCRYQEDYDEDVCRRCWHQYYIDAVNGEITGTRQRNRFARDADALFGR